MASIEDESLSTVFFFYSRFTKEVLFVTKFKPEIHPFVIISFIIIFILLLYIILFIFIITIILFCAVNSYLGNKYKKKSQPNFEEEL